MNSNEIFTRKSLHSLSSIFNSQISTIHSTSNRTFHFFRGCVQYSASAFWMFPSTVDLHKKESSSTPQMFIFPLANWVTQSLSCPLSSVSSSFFACGAGSNFSICDQLMLNCKHFPKSQRSVQVLSWKNLWKERKFEAKRFIIVLFFSRFAWQGRKKSTQKRIIPKWLWTWRNKKENLWEFSDLESKYFALVIYQ
jgi:hypothetical protein